MQYALRASKRICDMGLDPGISKRIYILASRRPRPKSFQILNHLLRCDRTRHKAISRYCPFKEFERFFIFNNFRSPRKNVPAQVLYKFKYMYILKGKVNQISKGSMILLWH